MSSGDHETAERPLIRNQWLQGVVDYSAFLVWVDEEGVMWEMDDPEEMQAAFDRMPDDGTNAWYALVEIVGRS